MGIERCGGGGGACSIYVYFILRVCYPGTVVIPMESKLNTDEQNKNEILGTHKSSGWRQSSLLIRFWMNFAAILFLKQVQVSLVTFYCRAIFQGVLLLSTLWGSLLKVVMVTTEMPTYGRKWTLKRHTRQAFVCVIQWEHRIWHRCFKSFQSYALNLVDSIRFSINWDKQSLTKGITQSTSHVFVCNPIVNYNEKMQITFRSWEALCDGGDHRGPI